MVSSQISRHIRWWKLLVHTITRVTNGINESAASFVRDSQDSFSTKNRVNTNHDNGIVTIPKYDIRTQKILAGRAKLMCSSMTQKDHQQIQPIKTINDVEIGWVRYAQTRIKIIIEMSRAITINIMCGSKAIEK